jgi:signal peptidase I
VIINGQPLEEEYPFYKTMGSTRDPDNDNFPLHYDTDKPGLANGRYVDERSWDLNYIKRRTAGYLNSVYKNLDRETYNRVMDRLLTPSEDGVERIPEGFYLMLGDNRNNSQDSRYWGLVPRELIEGRAYFVWWSYGEDEGSHKLEGFDLVWSYIRIPIYTFWTRTHWEETFTLIK